MLKKEEKYKMREHSEVIIKIFPRLISLFGTLFEL